MRVSRRRLGQIVLGIVAAGMSSWRGIGFARAASATIDLSHYPTLARLGSLYPDDAAWRRIASALSPSALVELASSGLARAERDAVCACAEKPGAGRDVLAVLLANDFRRGRTVQVGGFLLAETEAALMFVHTTAGSFPDRSGPQSDTA